MGCTCVAVRLSERGSTCALVRHCGLPYARRPGVSSEAESLQREGIPPPCPVNRCEVRVNEGGCRDTKLAWGKLEMCRSNGRGPGGKFGDSWPKCGQRAAVGGSEGYVEPHPYQGLLDRPKLGDNWANGTPGTDFRGGGEILRFCP